MKKIIFVVSLFILFSCSFDKNKRNNKDIKDIKVTNLKNNSHREVLKEKREKVPDIDRNISHYLGNRIFAFRRDKTDSVFIKIPENKSFTFVTDSAYNPYLSPDGKFLAFTKYDSKGWGAKRKIKLYELNNKKFTDITPNNDNSYGPIFSPDSKYLIFKISIDGWKIGLKKINEDGFKILSYEYSSYPSWTLDGNNICIADDTTLYFISLDGNIKNKISLNIFPFQEGFLCSQNIFRLNDSIFIFSANDPNNSTGIYYEPTSSIFKFNYKNKQIEKLTPEYLHCFELFITPDEHILFTGLKVTGKLRNIYDLSLNDKSIKLLLRNARNITCEIYSQQSTK